MENREIFIANTRTQQRTRITTDATTLGELKTALDNAGIDYSDMTFTEGISRTQLIDDTSLLPQNVMYRGNPTNNLVILLTNTKKNISSGELSRKDLYDLIKENNLQENIKKTFGRNFTQVPTAALDEFVSKNLKQESRTEEPEVRTVEIPEMPRFNWLDCTYDYIKALAKQGVFSADDLDDLSELLSDLADITRECEEENTPNSNYEEKQEDIVVGNTTISADDLDDMINSL